MSKTVLKEFTLYYTAGTSDKEYIIWIEKEVLSTTTIMPTYHVKAKYGKRGKATTLTVVSSSSSLMDAEKQFSAKVSEKVKKGYTTDPSGTPGLGLSKSATTPAVLPEFSYASTPANDIGDTADFDYYIPIQNWDLSVLVDIDFVALNSGNSNWFTCLPVVDALSFTTSLDVAQKARNLVQAIKADLQKFAKKHPSLLETLVQIKNDGDEVIFLTARGSSGFSQERQLAEYIVQAAKEYYASNAIEKGRATISYKASQDELDEVLAMGAHGLFKQKGTEEFKFFAIKD